jgi:endonuclease III
MNAQKKKARATRVQAMNKVLDTLYPQAHIELNYTTPFECFVAVLLSAQCTDVRVNMVTAKLFLKYRSVRDYAEAKQSVMERDVFSCGFYRNKAKNIIAAAVMLEEEFGGELPKTLEELMRLPGAARKTANVVLSSLYGITEGIAVDTHVRRFAIRFDLSDYTDPRRIEKDLMEIMPRSYWWSFNHRLVHYGRHCCPAHRHDCSGHPLTKIFPKADAIWPKAH